MIAAVYARKSTEQNVSDDAKSVARQIDLARAFAVEKGWDVVEVYNDDAISGALSAKLVGRARMLAAAAAGTFQALIVRDVDRLSRDDRELSPVLILDGYDVAVWEYATQSRVDTSTALNRGLLSMKSTFAAAESEAARKRTREAMRAKAARGEVAGGGGAYGYGNVEITGVGGKRDHVERRVNPTQAAIVRRIFEEIAAGRGFSRIAKGLNADGVPSPARCRGWATSGVRDLVLRDLYRGRVIYGKTRWEWHKGRKRKVDMPADDWIVREVPALRIVSDDLWRAAHARLDATRAEYRRLTSGRIVGRPKVGDERRDGKYLLSGLVQCAVCAGSMHATTRTGHRASPRTYYVCGAHRERGNTVCTNWWAAPMPGLHEAVLDALRRRVLAPAIVAEVVERTLALREQARRGAGDRRGELEAELTRLGLELRRYADAVAAAGPLPALLEALQLRERRRQEVRAQLAGLDALAGPGRHQGRDLRAALARRLEEWQALLTQHPVEARQTVLRPLLSARIVLTPETTPSGRLYRFAAPVSYGGLIAGLIETGSGGGAVTVVPPG